MIGNRDFDLWVEKTRELENQLKIVEAANRQLTAENAMLEQVLNIAGGREKARREEHAAGLKALSEAHESELKAINEAHELELAEKEKSYQIGLEALRSRYMRRITRLELSLKTVQITPTPSPRYQLGFFPGATTAGAAVAAALEKSEKPTIHKIHSQPEPLPHEVIGNCSNNGK